MASVGATQSTTATTPSATANDPFGGMGPDAFLKLLVAQLRYQNPMNPSDPTAMMGQVAQYAQVEALTKMQQGQATEQSLSEARMATEMVGKTITATDGAATEAGKVVSARFTATGPVLVLDTGTEVTLSAVVTVTDTPAAATSTSTSTGTSTGASTGTSTGTTTGTGASTGTTTGSTTGTSGSTSPFAPAVAAAPPATTVVTEQAPGMIFTPAVAATPAAITASGSLDPRLTAYRAA